MSDQLDLFTAAREPESNINTIIKSLYARGQLRNVPSIEAGKIAAEIDQETGEISVKINGMIEQLESVL